MKCLLHIGLQKCGSSSVQAWLRANHDWLAERGVAVLTEPWRLTALGWNYNPSFWIVRRSEASSADAFAAWKTSAKSDLEAEIAAARSAGHSHFVISQEDLSRLPASGVASVLEVLDGQFEALEVICFFRPHVALASSWLSQEAKNGTRPHPRKFLESFHSATAHAATTWSDAVGQVTSIPLARFPDAVKEMTDRLLLSDLTGSASPQTKNTSVGPDLFEFLLRTRDRSGAQYELESEVADQLSPRATRASGLVMPREAAETIQARHREETDTLLASDPSLERSDFDVDCSTFPEVGNFVMEPPPFSPDLFAMVQSANVDLWLYRAEMQIGMARRDLQEGKHAAAESRLRAIERHLAEAARAGLSNRTGRIKRFSARVKRLQGRLGSQRPSDGS